MPSQFGCKCFSTVSVVIGIPTVKRDSTSYLTLTLTSLTAAMSEKEKNDCLIVVFIAEVRMLLSCSNYNFCWDGWLLLLFSYHRRLRMTIRSARAAR